MSTEIDLQMLRGLHRILRQQTDLNERIRRGPNRVTVARQSEAAFQQKLDETTTLLKQTRIAADRKQKQLQEREAHIVDLQSKRNACESNREYQLLTDQIAADEQANAVQSDEILELLEKVDQIEVDVQQFQANLEKGQAETKRVQDKVQAELDVLNRDLEAVNSELVTEEAKLPVDVRAAYRRMVESVGEDALAVVSENSCGHCFTNLTTQVISDLMMQKATFCKSCGSLLYLSENANA